MLQLVGFEVYNTTCSSYDAMIGVTTHDYFDAFSDEDLTSGVTNEQRDRMLQTFVRNHYNAHLQVSVYYNLYQRCPT